MARGFISSLNQIAREAQRQQAQNQREAIKAQNARERAAEAQRRSQASAAKLSHAEARQSEVDALNKELEARYAEIDGILAASLSVDSFFDLNTLCRTPEHPLFKNTYLEVLTKKPEAINDPSEPVYLEPKPSKALFGKQKKHESAIGAAQAAHAHARTEWLSLLKANEARRKALQEEYERAEQNRLNQLALEKARYAEECDVREKEVAEYNASIKSLIANLGYGASDAVEAYISIVLSNSLYPDKFSVSHELKFEPSSAELFLHLTIPQPSELEVIKAYKYVKSSDEITSVELPQKPRKDRYDSVVLQVAMRSILEVFKADRRGLIKALSLELGTEASNPATGKFGFIPFVAVAAERERFLDFDLSAVVPKKTLELLGAAISKSPYDLTPADTSGVRRV